MTAKKFGPLNLETLTARANREGERLQLLAKLKYMKSVLLATRAAKKKAKEDYSEIELKLDKASQIRKGICYKSFTKDPERWESIKVGTEERLKDLLA